MIPNHVLGFLCFTIIATFANSVPAYTHVLLSNETVNTPYGVYSYFDVSYMSDVESVRMVIDVHHTPSLAVSAGGDTTVVISALYALVTPPSTTVQHVRGRFQMHSEGDYSANLIMTHVTGVADYSFMLEGMVEVFFMYSRSEVPDYTILNEATLDATSVSIEVEEVIGNGNVSMSHIKTLFR